jgi:hypothetical protein
MSKKNNVKNECTESYGENGNVDTADCKESGGKT